MRILDRMEGIHFGAEEEAHMAENGEITQFHFHFPAGFTGEVHVHVGETTNSARYADGQLVPPLAGTEPGSAMPAPARELEDILARFLRYDPSSPVRSMYEAMMRAGWTPYAPGTRKPGKTPEAYIRWVRSLPNNRRTTLYQETHTLASGGGAKRYFYENYLAQGVPTVLEKVAQHVAAMEKTT
jgi:hypothetical protein